MKSRYFFLIGIIFITINTQAMNKEEEKTAFIKKFETENKEKKSAFLDKLQKEQAAWLKRTANQKVLTPEHAEIIRLTHKSPVKNNHQKSSLLRDLNMQKIENDTLAQLEEINPKAFTVALYQESKQDN